MSTTSEIVERLKQSADSTDSRTDAADFRAAALRLSELERENARLREALKPFADPSSFLGNITDDDVQNARDVLGIVTQRRIGSSAHRSTSGER